MTETMLYLDGINHTEADEILKYRTLLPRDGYLVGEGSELAVIENTPAAMNVVVGTGVAWMGGLRYANSAPVTVTIDAADASYTRYDLVCVKVTFATNAFGATVHKGTAAASPVIPTPTQDTTAWEFPLAVVTVAPGTTSITTAKIADARKRLFTTTIPMIIEGGGAEITDGSKGYLPILFDCTVVQWIVLADQTGSIVVDVKKSTYAGFPTTSSIAGTDKPTLSSARKNSSSALTGWTTTISQGDVLEFVVDSCTTITRATVLLEVTV